MSPDAEKRILLKEVLSNCTWSQSEMKAENPDILIFILFDTP